MNIGRCLLGPFTVALIFTSFPATHRPSLGSEIALAQPPTVAPQEKTSELEASLFVQDAHLPNGKKGVQLIWIPQPVQKYCEGKTHKECSTIDYCIRTTDKHAAMCQHLSVDTTRLLAYPPDTTPRRVLSIVYFVPMETDKGFDRLARFFENAPKASLDHLSTKARIKTRVKLTRSADDDQFDVLEILNVPSS